MTTIPGSEMLSSVLHVVAQSLLLPIIATLLIILVYAIIQAGGLISEHSSRIRTDSDEIKRIITSISNPGTPEKIKTVIEGANLPQTHKEVLEKIALNVNVGEKSREAFARKLIEEEEIRAAKSIEKTDIIAKIGPAIGLIGTLIPMGPGLAALGSGDINTLAQNLMVAFDAAIIGLASASVAFVISRIRRRWYEDQLSTLDALAESILEVLNNVKAEAKTAIY
jgi:biopolymer transport protein ExbB/TolQ